MPRILIFDLKAKMAHFRLPDTTVTHASYPFIPRTTLHGLLASILGLERLDSPVTEYKAESDNLVGISLMAPVKSCFQKMSMLGKGWAGSANDSFNKPVSIELIVDPYYRIYYTGPHLRALEAMIESSQSKYHTYMGSCFCPVVPKYVGTQDSMPLDSTPRTITTKTVVPSFVAERLIPQPGCEYARAGGLHYRYLGGRQFEGTLNMVYEVNGKPVLIELRSEFSEGLGKPLVKFFELDGGELICMW